MIIPSSGADTFNVQPEQIWQQMSQISLILLQLGSTYEKLRVLQLPMAGTTSDEQDIAEYFNGLCGERDRSYESGT